MTWPSPRDDVARDRGELDKAIAAVLDSGRYVLGEAVDAFEREFAAWTAAPACVGVANGTDAVGLALRAAGVPTGGLVATVSNTAVATVAAIENAGAEVVFVDIDPETMTMSPESLAAVIHDFPVCAVVAVHLYGCPAELNTIVRIAAEASLVLVEDCAQAHGATWEGRHVGTFGEAGAFSFYPTKNLGAVGDGGAVIGSADIAEELRRLRQYGWTQRYISDIPGYNSRLDELQAAILSVKLRRLDEAVTARRNAAEHYSAHLRPLLTLPVAPALAQHAFHQYVVRTRDRDRLQAELLARGIPAPVLYPVPIHRQPAYAGRIPVARHGLDVTDTAATQILALPMHPLLSRAQQDVVIDTIVNNL